jgi:hypothetical protein
MTKVVIIHVHNEDPIFAEVEEMPKPTDNYIEFSNPRRRDGKSIPYVTQGAKSFLFPWHRLTFVEVMTADSEREETIEFFREDR